MDGPSLSHCMVDEKSARRCFSKFFDNFECRSRNSISCADNPNPVAQVFRHYEFEVVVVQPGISKSGLSSSLREILDATSDHVVTAGCERLRIVVSD